VRNKTVDAYVDNVANKPLVEVPESKATITETKEAKDLGLTMWTLSNGIHVVVKPTDFKNDEVLFGAYSPGGLSLLPPAEYVSGTVAASIVDQSGIGDFDATQLRKALTGKTVNVTPTMSDLQEGFSGNAAPKDIETMFQLIYMYFSKTRKDTVAYQSFMKRIRSMLENMGARPESVFSDTVAVTMASYHPLRKPMNLKRLEEVDLDVAYKVYLDRFADASGFTFVFVGNVTPEKLQPLVVRYLGALPASKRGETWKDMGVRVPEGKVEKTVNKGIDKKGLVLMTFTGAFEWNVKNRYILTSLGELLKIKLREEVREEKGGTYGVGVGASGTRYPRSEYRITINFGCNPDRVDELVSTANEVLKKVIAGGASAADIGKIQEIQRREREKSLKENGFWMGRLLTSYANNDDPAEMLQYNALVDGLNSDALKAAAAKYITLDTVKKFVLMPEKK
jgi:zinc protease